MEENLPAEKEAHLVPGVVSPTEHDVQAKKNEAILPVLQTFTDVIQGKIEDGSLAEELGEMKANQLLSLFAKVAAVLKGPAVQVGVIIPAPNPKRLQVFSARKQTPEQRERLHRKMDKERKGG